MFFLFYITGANFTDIGPQIKIVLNKRVEYPKFFSFFCISSIQLIKYQCQIILYALLFGLFSMYTNKETGNCISLLGALKSVQ